MNDKENFPNLPEHILMSFAVPDTVWAGDLASLPDEEIGKIRDLLKSCLETDEVDQILFDLERNFGTAVEMAKAECTLRRAIVQESTGAKKRSAKLGVRLRSKLGNLRAEFTSDTNPNDADICARILEDPLLERLVTMLIEQQLRGKVLDPLRSSTSLTIQHLPQVLDQLLHAVDQGVVSGRVKPALNFLAKLVVDAMFRATGKFPGRTWDFYTNEEKGIGLKICRILAEALNNALPEDFRENHPADMVKPFRNAIKLARKAG